VTTDRKARIQELEREAKKLRDEEERDNVSRINNLIDALAKGMNYRDLVIVTERVNELRSRAWTLEHDDDE
jgi:hypothetical protein